MISNLLHETRDAARAAGELLWNVDYVLEENTGKQCSWDDFRTMADTVYDKESGSTCILPSLCIVFKSGAKLSRWQYDGGEGWQYHPALAVDHNSMKLPSLFVGGEE